MGSGLGISTFIKHSNDSGGGGQWLKQWAKKGVGEVTFWLHTRAPIVACFTHSFMLEDEYLDKETNRKTPVLRYPRFVSPDAEVIHRNQYFRNDDKTLQVPPDRDPFLLLREWLRFADHLSLEEPIFKWQDTKQRQTHVWDRGELSLLVKRGKQNFNHTLDTKLDYLFVVVDNDDVDTGPVFARFGKLAAKKMQEVIVDQQKTWGDVEGDPLQHPYAFRMRADDKGGPMDAYKCTKNERAELTDPVWAKISSDEFPDPLPFGEPGDGDLQKIRDAFEASAQVELPLDAIFSEDPAERKALCRPRDITRGPVRASKAAQARSANPATNPPLPKPAAVSAAAKPATNGAAPAAGGPAVRRKKVDPAPPPASEPDEVETIPCEDCQHPMLATDTKCENCGSEYEVEEAPKPPPQPAASKPAANGAKPKPAPAGAKPKTAKEESEELSVPIGTECWSCHAALNDQVVCPSCGIEQGDTVPF